MPAPEPQILIVDDDTGAARVLVELLNKHGYAARSVQTPATAIQAIETQIPELILMDIELNADVDGIDLMSKIRQMGVTTPVCFVSASAENDVVDRAGKVSPVGYLLKPINPQQTIASIRLFLQSIKEASSSQAVPPPVTPLTRKELEDRVTGLPSRTVLVAKLRSQPNVRAAVLAVTHANYIRHRYGSTVWDETLIAYSQHLAQTLPESCVLGRWSKTAFVILVEEDLRELQQALGRITSSPLLYDLQHRAAMLRLSAVGMVCSQLGEACVEEITEFVTKNTNEDAFD